MIFETKFNLDDEAFVIIYSWEEKGKVAQVRQVVITGVSCYQARRKKGYEINYYTDVKNGAVKEADLYKTREEAIKAIEV